MVTLPEDGEGNVEDGGRATAADSITRDAYDRAFSVAATATASESGTRAASKGLSSLLEHVASEDTAHAVIFDCTASPDVACLHPSWIDAGVHVVTANNNAMSGPPELRKALTDVTRRRGKASARYLREVTVGGGLPVISTLRNLLESGDRVRRIDGILSVSMSYVLYRVAPPPGAGMCGMFDEEVTGGIYRREDDDLSLPSEGSERPPSCSISEAVREASALGLMESDPMKDLSFEYAAQCLMVLARELGMDDEYDVETILRSSEPLTGRAARGGDGRGRGRERAGPRRDHGGAGRQDEGQGRKREGERMRPPPDIQHRRKREQDIHPDCGRPSRSRLCRHPPQQ